jgi:hypothetical protein
MRAEVVNYAKLKEVGVSRVGVSQAGFYYDKAHNIFYVVESEVDPISEEAIITNETLIELGDDEFDKNGNLLKLGKPFDLTEIVSSQRVQTLVEHILTGVIPNPVQTRNFDNFVSNPDSPITQAWINACGSSECWCPVAVSPLGCIEFLSSPINARPDLKSYVPVHGASRKCLRRALSALRQHVSFEEFTKWMNKVSRMKMADEETQVILSAYRGGEE